MIPRYLNTRSAAQRHVHIKVLSVPTCRYPGTLSCCNVELPSVVRIHTYPTTVWLYVVDLTTANHIPDHTPLHPDQLS